MGDGVRGRRALVIDNWDSFTANVCGLIYQVTKVEPFLIPNTTSANDLDLLIQNCNPDFIVLCPGPGNPLNSADFGVNQHVLMHVSVPVLGICLGMQGIAAYHGATIDRVSDPRHGFPRSVFHHRTHPLFKDVPSPFTAVCYNSLCATGCSTDFKPIAWTENGVMMAVDAVGPTNVPQIGIQFHPESHLTEYGALLIRNFLSYYVKNAPLPVIPMPKKAIFSVPRNDAKQLRLTYRCVKCPTTFSSEALFVRLKSLSSRSSDCVWLDSADGGEFSYVSTSLKHRISFDAEKRYVADSERRGKVLNESETFFDYLQSRISSFSLTDAAKKSNAELPFDFVGGYVGYLSYEMKSECGERDPNSNGSCQEYPTATFAFVDRFIALDHRKHTAYIVVLSDADTQTDDAEDTWVSEVGAMITESIVQPVEMSTRPPSSKITTGFACRDSKELYMQKVSICLDCIADGHSYELCLTTQHVSMDIISNPLSLYLELRKSSPAPFSAFIQFDDVAICSCSPERFIRVDRKLQIMSQPIKGTIRRGASDSDDCDLQFQLESSSKDRAENLMITDLVRHDLAQCCIQGSVHVEQFCELQRFRHVFQLTSTIMGQLSSSHTAIDCIQAAFPPGSMTGAPKRRSVQILEEIERAPRGIYSGCLGFLSVNGSADFSVVIRTIICTPSSTSIGSGGAIVSLSDAESEHAEMLLKAEAPIQYTTRHLINNPK